MAEDLDIDAMLARFRERAAAVRNRNLPPIGGDERAAFLKQAQTDFQDFAIIGDASGAIEDGVLVLRVDLRSGLSLDAAAAAIDAANGEDPTSVVVDGVERPLAQVHGELAVEWLLRLDPEADPGPAARGSGPPPPSVGIAPRRLPRGSRRLPALAHRGQEAPRRGGGRTAPVRRHRLTTTSSGCSAIIRKEGLGADPAVQAHEDAVCLAFLDTQLDELAEQLGEVRAIEVLVKTARKMTPAGLELAASARLSPTGARLLRAALDRRRVTSGPPERGEEQPHGLSGMRRRERRRRQVLHQLRRAAGRRLRAAAAAPAAAPARRWRCHGAAAPSSTSAAAGWRCAAACGAAAASAPAGCCRRSAPAGCRRRSASAARRGAAAPAARRPPPAARAAAAPAACRRRSASAACAAAPPPPTPSVAAPPPPPVVPPPPPPPVAAPPPAPVETSEVDMAPQVDPDPVVAEEPVIPAEPPPPPPCRRPRPPSRRPSRNRLRSRRRCRKRLRSRPRRRRHAPVPPPPTAAPPVAAPAASRGDSHAVGMAFGRLSNTSKKSSRIAAGIVSVLLEPGELVECLVAGKVQDLDGLVVLTNKRLVVVNDRQFDPDVVSFAVDAGLTVRGQAEGNTATLTLSRESTYAQVARITDVQLAQELAQRIRARAAGG